MANPNGQNGSTQAPPANGGQKQNQAIQKVDPKQQAISNFNQYLELRKSTLSRVLPKHMTPERLIKVAMLAYSKTPKLRECSLESVGQAVMQAAELGLEPGGVLGHAYLVPYGNTCTLIPGYRGLIELARRSGEIESIEAHVVYANDKFTLKFGLDPVLEHEPNLDSEPGGLRFVYAIAKLKDGGKQLEVMTKAQVDAIRKRSKSGNNGPWVTDYEEMARKTVVRRLVKYLPLSTERAETLAKALELDNDNEAIDVTATHGDVEFKASSRSAAVLAKLQAEGKSEDAVFDVPDAIPEVAAMVETPSGLSEPNLAAKTEPAKAEEKPAPKVHEAAGGKIKITEVE